MPRWGATSGIYIRYSVFFTFMNLTVNGESRDLPDDATVRDLVCDLGLHKAVVAVEVNEQVVPRREHESTTLADGDRIELVTLVGGG